MPVIARFFGITIKIYWKDHAPPHFHAEYQGYEAIYNIKTGKIIDGILPKKQNKLVVKWAGQKQEGLQENWKLVQNSKKPIRIEGLE